MAKKDEQVEGQLDNTGTDAIEVPEAAAPVVATTMSDLAMLRVEASHKGRTGSGEGVMGKFKDRLFNILNEATAEATKAGTEVSPLPCGAVVRFFLKKTDIFNDLPKDDRYNRAYRYVAQAKKAINKMGWDIDKIGKENFLIYTGKVS